MKVEVTGFSNAQGNSKSDGSPYHIARLYRLSKIRGWKNDRGESVAAGFESTDRGAMEVATNDPALISALLRVDYPTQLNLKFEPHPDDPTRNIVVGFDPVKG